MLGRSLSTFIPKVLLSVLCSINSLQIAAATGAAVHALSDYSFRGISQTKGSPSYHIGVQASDIYQLPVFIQVDAYKVHRITDEDKSTFQVNYALGLSLNPTDNIAARIGQKWYTYHGHNKDDEHIRSKERNYPEWFFQLSYQQDTQVSVFYTDDALGTTNARNIAIEIRQMFPFWVMTEFYGGRVASFDDDKLKWDNDERYQYFGLRLSKQMDAWNFSLAAEGTSLNARTDVSRNLKGRGERKLIATLGYHWPTYNRSLTP